LVIFVGYVSCDGMKNMSDKKKRLNEYQNFSKLS